MGEIDVGRFGNRGWYKIVIWENEVDQGNNWHNTVCMCVCVCKTYICFTDSYKEPLVISDNELNRRVNMVVYMFGVVFFVLFCFLQAWFRFLRAGAEEVNMKSSCCAADVFIVFITTVDHKYVTTAYIHNVIAGVCCRHEPVDLSC